MSSPLANPSPERAASSNARPWLWLFGGGLLAFVLAQWLWVRPPSIGASWRECDTQAIARNFAREGIDPLRPRIDWRGDGPGFVECELALYPALIAASMRLVGEAEWPGQLISLLALVGSAVALTAGLWPRFGPGAAVLGGLTLLSSALGVSLSVRVMPDASALMFFALGWIAFVAYAEQGRLRWLWLSGLATLIATWIKTPALQLGLAQFLLLAFGHRARLRSPWPFLVWGLVLLGAALQLGFAHRLYLQTGHTFGVLAGGDTKFPHLSHLTMPGLYVDLLSMGARFGPGLFGLLAAGLLLRRRRLGAAEWALGTSYGLGVLISLRYSHSPFTGAHYHLFGSLLGAWLVAKATAPWLGGLAPLRPWRPVPAAVVALLALAYGLHGRLEIAWHAELADAPTVRLAAEAARHTRADELLVVRSPKPARDVFWGRVNNFEEPTLLYLADRRGWVLPADEQVELCLGELARRGARLFVDPRPASAEDPPVTSGAQLLHSGIEGSLWRLPGP